MLSGERERCGIECPTGRTRTPIRCDASRAPSRHEVTPLRGQPVTYQLSVLSYQLSAISYQL